MTSWLETKLGRRSNLDRLKGLYAELLQQTAASEIISQREMELSPRIRPRRRPLSSFRRRCSSSSTISPANSEQPDDHLATAFRVLSATRFADKEGDNGGAISLREDESVAAMTLAKSMERDLVELVREIGEIVINEQQHFYRITRDDEGGDEIFEYFCEKAILGLLAEIVAAKPAASGQNSSNNINKSSSGSFRGGVVWSPRVKAQIIHTVSLLVSTVKDASALYFLLSKNSINLLIAALVPLRQWTEQALEIMLPSYVELLKNCSLQLGSSPHLFPLFLVPDANNQTTTTFPLFTASLDVLTSKFAQSDSFVHATCLNMIVSILQMDHTPVQDWISSQAAYQQVLANHICQRLKARHDKMAQLTTGPVVDSARSRAIAVQTAGLRDQIDALNDLFWSCRSWSVRLCETVLRKLVWPLLHDIITLPANGLQQRPMLVVGLSDIDVIPEQEAFAQSGLLVLSALFGQVQYDPFVRMLAVALFHPQSSQLWLSKKTTASADNGLVADDDYALTQALNALVKGTATETSPNMFRNEILKSLQGVYGDWRVCPAAILMDKVIHCQALGLETLTKLEIVAGSSSSLESSSVERSLTEFFQNKHGPKTTSLQMALECNTSLAIKVIQLHRLGSVDENQPLTSNGSDAVVSLRKAMESTRDQFFRRLLAFQDVFGVSDIFVGLVEDAAQQCYKHHAESRSSGRQVHVFLLNQHDCSMHGAYPDVLIRRLRSVEDNDVDDCRFNARMAIHLRAVCRIVQRLLDSPADTISSSGGDKNQHSRGASFSLPTTCRFVDEAEDLGRIFSRLQESIGIGEEIDLRGRMVFPFTATIDIETISPRNATGRASTDQMQKGSFSAARELLSSSDSQLTLVLDPTKMYIAKATGTVKSSRGSIICCIPLLQVIAAASDGDTLHIAVQRDDVDGLIQNGNLTLHFGTAGTSLVVQQYLERSRQVLRGELLEKITQLFSVES